MVRRIAFALLVVGTGCGSLLGLDSPELKPTPDAPGAGSDSGSNSNVDTDGDGVLDGDDNCPATPNADQADTDGDHVGDACQGCVALPLRASDDDDADTLVDTVDNCFGIKTAQADADTDGIGDACDARNGPDVRFCVWTFRDPGAGESPGFWATSWDLAGGWQVTGSTLAHTSSMEVEPATTRDMIDVPAGGIAFDTRYVLAGYTAPMTYGAAFDFGTSTYACRLDQPSAANAAVHLYRDDAVIKTFNLPLIIPSNLEAYVRLAAIAENDKLTIRCTVDAPALPSVSMSAQETVTAAKVRPRVLADHVNISLQHIALYKLGM